MPKKNSLTQVPYRKVFEWTEPMGRGERVFKNFELAAYAGYGDFEWRPNEPFEATLTLDSLERGRSAARFWFRGEDGTRYPMFGQGLVEMLSGVILDHGVVTATWIAVKRGANYGIERYEEN